MVSQRNSALTNFPKILIVSRRTLRKNKYVDFVGEYHLSLLVQNSAVPILVPRVAPTSALLEAYQPFDGLLLVEGEDIGPAYKPVDETLSTAFLASVAAAHPGDASPDHEKDSIEFALVRTALAQGVPILAICRGCQIVNVVAGGDLIPDIDIVHAAGVAHIDYNNYDDHRHPINITPSTPLHRWFDHAHALHVNSYHHQAINRLAPRFAPMAHAPDHLVEAYYDPNYHDPEHGKFIVGLQFHPERMQNSKASLADEPPIYDYPGCPRPYEEFVIAATAYRRKRLGHQRSPLTTSHRINQHKKVSASTLNDCRLSNGYTKEDLQRIIRSGGTVHGSTLVLKMLHNENAYEGMTARLGNDGGVEGSESEVRSRNQWKRFRRALHDAERAMCELGDHRKIKEAQSLLRKVTDGFSKKVSDECDRQL